MSTSAAPDVAEHLHALDPVPEAQRESTSMHQFWIWAGANIAPINWVLGALGIVLGLSLADTILVLVLGNLIGMAVFGFFVLMGQRTGVSQMVLTRSAFGVGAPTSRRSSRASPRPVGARSTRGSCSTWWSRCWGSSGSRAAWA
jgi:purine-cytosine permease-like protein